MTLQSLRSRLAEHTEPGSFRASVLTLLTGSTAAMALAYLAQPVITRLYSPSDFGVFDTFAALTTVLAPLLSLRYEDAILLPKEDDDAANILWLSLAIGLLLTAATLFLIPLREPIARLLGDASLARWIALVPAALLLLRVNTLTEYWLQRHKRFGTLSTSEVTQVTVTTGYRLLAVLLVVQIGAAGLIGGYLAGLATTSVLLVVVTWRTSQSILRQGMHLASMRRMLRRYVRFPLYSAPSLLLKTLASRLPILLLIAFFDAAVVGYFGRAFMALSVPLAVAGRAIGRVYHVEAASLRHSTGVARLTEAVHGRLVLLGLFPTLALMIGGPDIMAFVFGSAWRPAGHYLQYLGPWLLFSAVASPLTALFDVLEQQRADFVVSFLLFAVQTSALVAAALTGAVHLALLALGAAGALLRILHIGVMLHLADVPLSTMTRAYVRGFGWSLPFLIPVAVAVLLGPPLVVTITTTFCGAAYLAVLWWRGTL